MARATAALQPAAEALGYASIGVERDAHYFAMARAALPRLAALEEVE